MKKQFWFIFFLVHFFYSQIWQQKTDYQIDIKIDTINHQFTGVQKITYTNFSPDTLKTIYLHLHYNAFTPNSVLARFQQQLPDPDARVLPTIEQLDSSQYGGIRIEKITIDQKNVNFSIEETILKINTKIIPNQKINIELNYTSQIPYMIRRTGRQNAEGVFYSMAQWYPKMAVYDGQGFKIRPYVGREYYSDFGDYQVNISLPQNFVVAGTGILETEKVIENGYKKWSFIAKNVHDFAFAADPNYTVDRLKYKNIDLQFVYLLKAKNMDAWALLEEKIPLILEIIEKKIGPFPYPQYSFIQAGDGGMEYPQCTFILGDLPFEDLLELALHEFLHTYFQGVLANDEADFAWMDEGAVTYYTAWVLDELNNSNNGLKNQKKQLLALGIEQKKNISPILSAHFFPSNTAYALSNYQKGALFFSGLELLLGVEKFDQIIQKYYQQFAFKHPNPSDLQRLIFLESGIQTDWYFQQFLTQSDFPAYRIQKIEKDLLQTYIHLERKNKILMPLDVVVKKNDGSFYNFHIPVDLQLQPKTSEKSYLGNFVVMKNWSFVDTNYVLKIPFPILEMDAIGLDPKGRFLNEYGNQNFVLAQIDIEKFNPKGSKTQFELLLQQGDALGFSLLIENKKGQQKRFLILEKADEKGKIELEIPYPFKYIRSAKIVAEQGFWQIK